MATTDNQTTQQSSGQQPGTANEQSAAKPGALAREAKAAHKRRTKAEDRPEVDARLDNRAADELVPVFVSTDPDAPKPQHVDGPDLAGQEEHTAAVLKERGV